MRTPVATQRGFIEYFIAMGHIKERIAVIISVYTIAILYIIISELLNEVFISFRADRIIEADVVRCNL